MTLTRREIRRSVGRLLLPGFDGHAIPSDLRKFIAEFDLAGIILFARNVEAPEQVAELANEFRTLVPRTGRLVAVDQEGGRVARLKEPFTRWPPAAALGERGSEEVAGRWARALARELRAVGINFNTVPVLDVNTNPRNPVIGDRALSADPAVVARLGVAIVRALKDGDVAACAKHFPGHGDTAVDSHLDLPLVEHPPERLREVELRPFRAAIAAGVPAIMVGHLLVPAFDEERPTSLSRRVVTDLLRGELGFGGVVVADDLEMKAVAARRRIGAAVVEAVQAGCDLCCICSGSIERQLEAAEALVRAVEQEDLAEPAIERAFRRLDALFFDLVPTATPVDPRQARSLIGTNEHLALAAEIAQVVC